MRPFPHRDAVLIPADEVRRHGEPVEVIRLERRRPIRGGQRGESIRPCPPVEALPAARACRGRRRHAAASRDSPATSASRGAPDRASVPPDTRASYARRVAHGAGATPDSRPLADDDLVAARARRMTVAGT